MDQPCMGCAHCREGRCRILELANLPQRECRFRQTPEEAQEAKKSAFKRLASLPDGEQGYISEKYYRSRMPWNASKEDAQ